MVYKSKQSHKEVSLLLENPRRRMKNTEQMRMAACRSHKSQEAWALLFASALPSWIFEQKRDCLQSTSV